MDLAELSCFSLSFIHPNSDQVSLLGTCQRAPTRMQGSQPGPGSASSNSLSSNTLVSLQWDLILEPSRYLVIMGWPTDLLVQSLFLGWPTPLQPLFSRPGRHLYLPLCRWSTRHLTVQPSADTDPLFSTPADPQPDLQPPTFKPVSCISLPAVSLTSSPSPWNCLSFPTLLVTEGNLYILLFVLWLMYLNHRLTWSRKA